MKEEVFLLLDEMNIKYDFVTHPATLDTEEADAYIEGKEGVRSKTMLLSDRKDREFFLFVLDENKRLDIKSTGALLGDKKLHFAKEEALTSKLGLIPGMVSLFGLINNTEKDIQVFIDKALLSEKIITFFPNDNTATVFISMDDMFKFLDNIGYSYQIIDL